MRVADKSEAKTTEFDANQTRLHKLTQTKPVY